MVYRNDVKYFRKKLLAWFDDNKRYFPWRREGISNYEIILSEILLQRTKAETVAKYYNVFFNKYPNWDSLIQATEKDLEAILRPLGLYKHRAKRIMKIVKELKEKDGELPKTKVELQESSLSTLYIANAFELFILKKRAPLLDVNMARVLNRYFHFREFRDVRNDIELQELSQDVINVRNCKKLNWAIIDYAASVCKSRRPQCNICVLKKRCKYYFFQNDSLEVGEPQLSIYYDEKRNYNNPGKPIKLLSLFSGCGGMDLGFEGGFIVHKNSVNTTLNPDYVEKEVDKNYVKLRPTKFQTVFANDIINTAKYAWVNYFEKRGYSPEIYHVESIVNLVKQHK